ncbi:MAG: hypothetical protein ABSH12_09720, partial [Endomicrobiales bacterium]
MMIQGPLVPFYKNRSPLSLRVLGDAIDGNIRVTDKRIDRWVSTSIGIKNINNVIFIKTHTHGATDYEAVLGDEMNFILSYFERKYSDKKNYILHYVTARQMYNVIKALENGEDPQVIESYRNYMVSCPVYNESIDIKEASDQLNQYVYLTYK